MSDETLIARYGLPSSHWSEDYAPHTCAACVYGPVTFKYPSGLFSITWKFYFAVGATQTTIVRVAGGDRRSTNAALRLLTEVQYYALRTYQSEAVRARDRRWNETQNENRRTQELEQTEKARQQAIRDRWMADLDSDKRRVIAEIMAGNEAAFSRDWEREAQQWIPGEHGFLVEARRSGDAIKQARQDREYAVARAKRQVEEARQVEAAVSAARLAAERLEAERNRVWPSSSIIVGIDVQTGDNVRFETSAFQHTLVGGMTGAGKTVWLHGLLTQLLKAETVERLVLIDLKKFEFRLRYGGHDKVTVYNELADVADAFERLIELMAERETIMLAKGWRNWKEGRVFVVIDEYEEIHQFIDEAKKDPAQKALAARLNNNLKRVGQRARSSGIVLICALQKPTSDGISSAIRANMGMRVCFPVKTRQSVEAVLDANVDELPMDPRDLETGQFVLDGGRGEYRHMKTWVPPGFDLDD